MLELLVTGAFIIFKHSETASLALNLCFCQRLLPCGALSIALKDLSLGVSGTAVAAEMSLQLCSFASSPSTVVASARVLVYVLFIHISGLARIFNSN